METDLIGRRVNVTYVKDGQFATATATIHGVYVGPDGPRLIVAYDETGWLTRVDFGGVHLIKEPSP